MIFVANILEMNGGTTFLIRTCEALRARGEQCAVVVLRRGGDVALASALAEQATVLMLEDFQPDRGHVFRKHFGAFAPLYWSRLQQALAPFGTTIHAMGAFGLIFAARLGRHIPSLRITAGIYHQNEFVFRDRALFSRQILSIFRALPPENVVFFNEIGRENYSLFHAIDYTKRAPLTPIGIKIAPGWPNIQDHEPGYEIVSIGALEPFKTYNTHIITLLPELGRLFPGVRYHVYGAGECLEPLRSCATALGVADSVLFHGLLPYERFHDVVRHGDVFVGSGTALIEAASLGRPALIGIESMAQPVTYGFLSDVAGLSYNESGLAQDTRPMLDCLRAVFSDAARWRAVAEACSVKAAEFSVDRTAEAFVRLQEESLPTPALISPSGVARLLAELPALALWDKMSPEFAFARRRNQSFQR